MELGLVSLLARVLMRFTLDQREGSPALLLTWSNLLRVLDAGAGTAVRDLPRLTGISKEALAVLTGRLEKAGVVLTEPLRNGARGRQLRLTPRGDRARAACERRIEETIRAWVRRDEVTAQLADALHELVGDGTSSGSPLWKWLEPPAEGWRAQVPGPALLPWYPMLTHRGGYPDGA